MDEIQGTAGAVAQVVTATGFGGFCWYLIVKFIPSMTDRFRADLKEERTVFLDEIGKMRAERVEDRESHAQQTESTNAAMKEAMGHIGERIVAKLEQVQQQINCPKEG